MSQARPIALITRPREDAGALAERLRDRGYHPLIEPLLAIQLRAGPPPDLAGVQGILITSANGARALAARLGGGSPLPVWAVGEASADAARNQGFTRVASAGGDVADLAALVAAEAEPGAGPLLHAAGKTIAGDLGGLLADRGFAVRREILYDAQPAQALSADLVGALKRGGIAVALFFSPRTASSFVRLAAAQELTGHLAATRALALSPAVAAALAGPPWRGIEIAERPNQAALLAMLDGETGC